MSASHTIHSAHHHFGWDNALVSVMTVAPGDSVEIDTVDSSGGQLTVDSDVSDVSAMDFGKVNPVTGPIKVDGAEAGELLKVTRDTVEASGWGWTAIVPG